MFFLTKPRIVDSTSAPRSSAKNTPAQGNPDTRVMSLMLQRASRNTANVKPCCRLCGYRTEYRWRRKRRLRDAPRGRRMMDRETVQAVWFLINSHALVRCLHVVAEPVLQTRRTI